MKIHELSATEIAKKLRNKEVSAKEIVLASVDRILKTESKIDAFITLNEKEALETAVRLDKMISNNEEISPLAGIPLGVKDNISTKGLLTTSASKMLENYVPPFDAAVIKKIKEQNMPIMGKLNMDEFAMGASTETSYFKKTKNPIDLSRVPGGSSGGSAAAVAAGQVTLALGSDTGGSIRQPASFTGLVGLKPTYGSVSRQGLIAYASSFDQISPIGRSVSDVALLYENITGEDKKDPTTFLKDIQKYTEMLDNIDIKGLKIGLPSEIFSLEGIETSVKNSVLSAVEKFKAAGAVVKEVSIPSVLDAAAIYYIIATSQASSNLGRIDGVSYGFRAKDYDNLEEMYEKSRSEGFGWEVKKRIMLGTFFLAGENVKDYYHRAVLNQKNMVEEFKKTLSEVDLIITPTTPTTAYKFGSRADSDVWDILSTPPNITGLPAISIPCGLDEKNLPIGMQIIGNYNKESDIFSIAKFYENLVGGFKNNLEV